MNFCCTSAYMLYICRMYTYSMHSALHVYVCAFIAASSQDMKLHENLRVMKSTDIKDYFLTIVYRQDGITNVDYIGVMCEAPGVAARWKKAVNSLLLRNPHRNATMATFLSKQ